ncbi:hypothetical protein P0D69_44915 [Paraburkholderia sediminicola]|uniref:hypothetical protein n=1 Tax=Paraburkholderia sediminicola TaxID=458836 RepID=UPI0038B90963
MMQISQLRNHFPLVHGPRPLFAGGIGITPTLCMTEILAHSARSSTGTTARAHLQKTRFATA